MKLLEKLNTLERLDQLIRMKATGTPQELADRLGFSKRKIFDLLNDLRMLGAEISYNVYRESYQYDEEIYFDFQLVVTNKDAERVKGGQFLNFFHQCRIFALGTSIFEMN